MKVLDAVEKYLEKKGKVFVPEEVKLKADNLGYGLDFGAAVSSFPAKIRIFLSEGGQLHFKTVLPVRPEKKKARQLIIAANAINGYIKFGKFVVTANNVYFDISRHTPAEEISDSEIRLYINASHQTVKTYIAAFTGLNSGKLMLKDFLEGLN